MAFAKLSSLLDRPPLIDSTLRPKIYLALSLFLLLTWGSWKGWSLYEEKQEEHWVQAAEELLQKKDWRGASIAARRALYLHRNPGLDLRATEIMAAISREFQIPQEIYWRSELVRMQPDSFKAKEELIQTSIRHNSLLLANNTLESIPPAQRNQSAFHRLMSVYALASHQPAYAQAALREALKHEPGSTEIRLNLAKVLLAYGTPSNYSEAQDLLNSLQPTPENEADILRSRIEAFNMRNLLPEALNLSNQLVAHKNVNFNDKVNRLTLLYTLHSALFNEYLSTLETESSPHPGLVYQLASWLRGKGMPGEALRWLNTFPEESLNSPPLIILWSECAVSAKEWSLLTQTLEDQDWGETDSLRFAFLARAQRETTSAASSIAPTLLQKSLSLAKSNPGLSLTLGDLFFSWSWPEEAVEAWWQATNPPQSKLALGKLFDLYKQEKNLNGIWRVSKTASELDSTDLIARNNFAMTSLILGKSGDAAAVSARDLYLKNPQIPAFASTFGFSLYLQKKNKEALAVFEEIPPELLRDPGVAPYYVLVLLRNKRTEEAEKFRSYVQPATLFPEELDLYQKANPVK